MANARPMMTFALSGDKELAAAFQQLPKSVGDSVLRAVAKEALQPVLDDAKTNIVSNGLVRTGDLLNSMQIGTRLSQSQRQRRRRGDVVLHVGSSSPLAHLPEFGTGDRTQLKSGRDTGMLAPHPFMRPAWDNNKAGTLETMRAQLWKHLARAAKRLYKRAAAGKLSRSQTRALSR